MEYSEYLIEYDNHNNIVYISGLDPDQFWIELETQSDVADPESYAWGRHEAYKQLNIFSTIINVDEIYEELEEDLNDNTSV